MEGLEGRVRDLESADGRLGGELGGGGLRELVGEVGMETGGM
jgi:hypothetical protein